MRYRYVIPKLNTKIKLKGSMMKKRIAILAVALFVTSVFISTSYAGIVTSSNDVTMGAAKNCQPVDCGKKCEKAEADCKKSCCAKEGCEKSCPKKESCEKSGEQKAECSKSKASGCPKKSSCGK